MATILTTSRVAVSALRPTQTNARLGFIDGLRVFLTILVILHHAAIAYGGAGDWPVKDPTADRASQIVFSIFNAVNQAYFMSLFFLIAGYFTLPALSHKGTKRFLGDRLIRLGIPLLLYSTLMVNMNKYVLDVYYRGVTFHPLFGYSAGHLWFVQALLIFAVIFALYYEIARRWAKQPHRLAQREFPSDTLLFGWIGLLALLTFVVRLRFPVGVWVMEMQLGHFVHYIFAFVIGAVAYQQDWLNRIPLEQSRRWGWRALLALPFFLVLVVLSGALEDQANIAHLQGGWHWSALGYTLWESWLMVAMIVWLIPLFRQRLNQAGTGWRTLAANAYTVYIIHQSVLIIVNVALLSAPFPATLKFTVAALCTVVICFGLSELIRKLPLAQRIVG